MKIYKPSWDPCCPPDPCCFCPLCPCPPPIDVSFSAVKRDQRTGTPLPGAIYTLYQCGEPVQSARSNSSGILQLNRLKPGIYDLIENIPPKGYQADTRPHRVVVNADGTVFIDGIFAKDFTLFDVPLPAVSFKKIDAVTGLPLAGAVFTLSNGAAAVSGNDGAVDFGTLPAGTYTLTETSAPAQYVPDPNTYQVVVTQNNEVTINGIPADQFVVQNQPQPSFSFRKYDERTGLPLAGATFLLSNGQSVTSNSGGLVNFGVLSPGVYAMTESAAPNGYQPNPTKYTVEVRQNGQILINGISVEEFSVNNTPASDPSPKPIILAVTEGDNFVTGTGVPGAQIVVSLPDGTKITTTVDASGYWLAAVPQGTTLQAGQVIHASQTVSGQSPSENASYVVQSRA